VSAELVNLHSKSWALFGSTGVTGQLALEKALARGHRPTLVGRDLAKLNLQAKPHRLEVRHATLEDADSLRDAIAGHRVVLNVAGPFKRTAQPIINSSLANAIDYIDLNGELEVLQHLLDSSDAAAARGVVLVGGAGFGVAATDGLTLQVSERLGGAEWFRLSVASDVAFSSPAVANSTLEVVANGGWEVEDGNLVRRRLARWRWAERLSNGQQLAFASAPLAELAAVRHATGARWIQSGVPASAGLLLSLIAPLLPALLKLSLVRKCIVAASGHSAGSNSCGNHISRVWVEGGKNKQKASALLEAGEGYALAAEIGVLAVEALLANRPAPGAYTPATAFGPDFITKADGVRITHSRTETSGVRQCPNQYFVNPS
jgi:short subunit dehydrogenase-like uncharacterized protein